MKHTYLLLTLTSAFCLLPFALFSQNTAPVVSGITVQERTDCSFIVDIHYNVHDADGNTMTVSMQLSNDNGATWNYSFSPANVTGAIGPGITSGQNKLISWNFGADHPNAVVPNIKVKILADDGVIPGPGVPCPGLPSFFYGGQTYNTVQIGTQCWMKENLNIGTYVPSIYTGSIHSDVSNNGIVEKYCYDNNPANCAIYGGLYDWNEMMQYTTTPGTQGICPSGWHLPTDEELCTLTTFLDATVNCNTWGSSGTNAGGRMKETGFTHWYSPNEGATNESGFTALGAGYRNNYGTFSNLSGGAYFWSSSENSPSTGINRNLYYNNAGVYRYYNVKTYGFSVRCVRTN